MTITVLQEVLPVRVAYGAETGDQWETEYVETGGGFAFTNQRQKAPRRRFTLDAENLDTTTRDALFAFGRSVARGRLNNFLAVDKFDYTSQYPQAQIPVVTFADQPLFPLGATPSSSAALGDGVTTQFQLGKSYPSPSNALKFTRVINFPKTGTVVIADNGVQQLSGWSVSLTTGVVTFVSAPTSGHTLTAGFQFYVPVKFDADYFGTTFDKPVISMAKQMTLTEVRVQ